MTSFWFKFRFFAMLLDCDGSTNILWIYHISTVEEYVKYVLRMLDSETATTYVVPNCTDDSDMTRRLEQVAVVDHR